VKERIRMYIQYKKQAVKYIETCDKPTKRRLKEAIEKLPLGDVKKLSGYDKEYRLRVGDMRVLFTIEDETIIINSILPRGQVYKRV
jgi:mRNA interferase RelE/StbE